MWLLLHITLLLPFATSSGVHLKLLESLPVSCDETECRQLCSLVQHPIYGKGDCEVSCQLDPTDGFNCSSVCNCPMAMTPQKFHKIAKRSAVGLASNGWMPRGYQYPPIKDYDYNIGADETAQDYDDQNDSEMDDIGTNDMSPADRRYLMSLYEDVEDNEEDYDYSQQFSPLQIPQQMRPQPMYPYQPQPQVFQPQPQPYQHVPQVQRQQPVYQQHQYNPAERVLFPPKVRSAQTTSKPKLSTPRAIRDDRMTVKINHKRTGRPVDCDTLKCAQLCEQFSFKLGNCESDFDRPLNYPAKCVCSEKYEADEDDNEYSNVVELTGYTEESASFDCQNCSNGCIAVQSQLPSGFCLQSCNYWPGRGCEARCLCPIGSDWLESPPVVKAILPCNIDRCKKFCLAMGKLSEGCVMYKITSKELNSQCRCV